MIVATMMSGNSAALVGAAVRSALAYVDLFLLIDTGITDDTERIVRGLAGEKFRRAAFPWQNDFAAARNFSLAAATVLGATWTVTVDSDERLHFPGYADRDSLWQALTAAPQLLVWLVPAAAGDYCKERFIRVPTPLRWQGRMHEAFIGAAANERSTLGGCTFSEEPKDAATFQAKLRRDVEHLEAETQNSPHDPRWWFYLGQTYDGLGELPAAIRAYRRCAELDGWDEQAAWACFQAASCHERQQQYREALELCGLGLTKHSGFAELPWLAALCSHRLGENRKAEWWAEMSILLGNFEGLSAGSDRVSFRYLPAWYEGPFDVLRFALRELGDEAGAASAEKNYELAKRQRESIISPASNPTSLQPVLASQT